MEGWPELFNPLLALLHVTQASIAVTALVSPRWQPLADNLIGARVDQSILVSFCGLGRSVEFRPVDLQSGNVSIKAQ